MDENLGIILQARTGSTRLPNKMILPFYKDEGVLSILLQRIKKRLGDQYQIIVATTISVNDDIIVEIAESLGISVYRGSENDVLGRFIEAAELNGISKIIRICADNPFLDLPSLVTLINLFKDSDADYLTYSTSQNVPTVKTHFGFWAEAVRLHALKIINEKTSEKLYHEHVTNYIYTHEDLFDMDLLHIPEKIERHGNIRLTLDTTADFELQGSIYAQMISEGIELNIDNIVNYLDLNSFLYEKMRREIINNTK